MNKQQKIVYRAIWPHPDQEIEQAMKHVGPDHSITNISDQLLKQYGGVVASSFRYQMQIASAVEDLIIRSIAAGVNPAPGVIYHIYNPWDVKQKLSFYVTQQIESFYHRKSDTLIIYINMVRLESFS